MRPDKRFEESGMQAVLTFGSVATARRAHDRLNREQELRHLMMYRQDVKAQPGHEMWRDEVAGAWGQAHSVPPRADCPRSSPNGAAASRSSGWICGRATA